MKEEPKVARALARIAVLSLAFATALHADEPSLLTEARKVRGEGIPEVAVQKLRTLLKSTGLAEEVRRAANYELADALLAGGHFEEAQRTIQPFAEAGENRARMLVADIQMRVGQWAQALELYQELMQDDASKDTAQLRAAECFHALGQTKQAIEVLKKFVAAHPGNTGAQLRLAGLLVDAGDLTRARDYLKKAVPRGPGDEKAKKYVEGRLLLASDQAAPALALFEEVMRDLSNVSESLVFGVTLGSMEARAILNGYDSADGVLEKFISRYPESPYLAAAFRRLDEVYSQEEHPSDNELKKNAGKGPARRAAFAQYYLARLYQRVGKAEKAFSALDSFVETYPSHPLLPLVHIMRADDYLRRNDLSSAVVALEAAMRAAKSDEERAAIELRTGLVHYRQGEALLAANSFRRAAQRSEKLREHARFDAALADLTLRNYERFGEDFRTLGSEYPNSPLLSSLVFEEGITQARAGDPRAADTLELFVHHFPKHPRLNEARLALAELAWQSGNGPGTAQYLRVVNTAAPDADTGERAAYLAVFAADSETPPVPAKVIGLGQKFVERFPHSPYLPEVRMKLGQIYSATEDHANAETQFTLLARENPQSPYAETALYLAGQAARRWVDPGAAGRALGLFDEVVKRGGTLKLYARQQQAGLQGVLGKHNEAVTIYDAILAAQPPPDAELRYAVLCGKGMSLEQLGRTDTAQLEAAIEVFDSLAALPEVTPAWRNQALYRKGRALEMLKRPEDAVTAYYDVLEKSAAEGKEFFWYYKAGFDAAAIFEKQSDWKAAIGIYQKMASLDGPRAGEAKARLTQLRLERFIWD